MTRAGLSIPSFGLKVKLTKEEMNQIEPKITDISLTTTLSFRRLKGHMIKKKANSKFFGPEWFQISSIQVHLKVTSEPPRFYPSSRLHKRPSKHSCPGFFAFPSTPPSGSSVCLSSSANSFSCRCLFLHSQMQIFSLISLVLCIFEQQPGEYLHAAEG